jgi:hypothetical protein
MKTLSELSELRDLHLINGDKEKSELYSKAVNYRMILTDADIYTRKSNRLAWVDQHDKNLKPLIDKEYNDFKKEIEIFDLIIN